MLGKLEQALPVKVTELPMQDGVPQPVVAAQGIAAMQMSLVPFAHISRLYKSLEEITMLGFGEYMQPVAENEPAIDSFCLSKGVPREPNPGDDPVLLMFQMTVAVKHPTVGQRIKEVIECAHRAGGNDFDKEKHKIYLVFITEEPFRKGEAYLKVGKREPLLPAALGDLTRIQQFCLQIT